MGTWVKRLVTSKLTSWSSGASLNPRILSVKAVEFFIVCSVRPASGAKICDSSFARPYEGEPMAEIMGLIGHPSLCIFGNPYIWGGLEYLGVSRSVINVAVVPETLQVFSYLPLSPHCCTIFTSNCLLSQSVLYK